jgi:hypothetical protein
VQIQWDIGATLVNEDGSNSLGFAGSINGVSNRKASKASTIEERQNLINAKKSYSQTEMHESLMIASSSLKTNYSDETIMSSQSSQTELNNSLMIASSPLKTIYSDEKR